MIIELENTTAGKISSTLVRGRRELGSPASGMVLTLVVAIDEEHFETTLSACREAGREHPSRILLVVRDPSRASRLNASLHVGEKVPGEIIVLRMSGQVGRHPDSVVLPLLLPDSPVVIWWPTNSPVDPGQDPLGRLADRRITDAMGSPHPLEALLERAEHHAPGDTDLTWTRLTPWRALLAASLDQFPTRIESATVDADDDNAPANLLAAWLESRLGVEVRRTISEGPGITAVRLTTPAGDIAVTREDGLMASYLVPGQPKRLVALRRRDINQLITEELRRMDADDIFEAATETLLERHRRGQRRSGGTKKSSARKVPAKRASGGTR